MEKQIDQGASPGMAAFFSLVNNPLKFRLYLLRNLPAAFFSGVKLKEATPVHCTATVPFRWLTQNPFRSTYFASLSMAAELSTGILAMAHVYGRKPAVSMLVLALEAGFHKKAKGVTYFTCRDGGKIADAIQAATVSGISQEVKAYSAGTNQAGDLVAEFWITWSFKVK
jgi:hypothetical protein